MTWFAFPEKKPEDDRVILAWRIGMDKETFPSFAGMTQNVIRFIPYFLNRMSVS